MKSLLIILFLSLLIQPLSAQKNDTLRVYLDQNLALTRKKDMLFTGLLLPSGDHWMLYAVYPDASPLMKVFFLDRKMKLKDGPAYVYYKNHQPAMQGIFVRNRREGVWKFWDESGALTDSGLVKDNYCTGYWESRYPNGQLKEAGDYLPAIDVPAPADHTDEPAGKNNSVLYSDSLWQIRQGSWQSWYENGQRKDSGAYKQNKREGYWRSWYSSGVPESEGPFQEGNREGNWIFYYENGQPSTHETYLHNRVTALTCFDEKGQASGSSCSLLKPPVPLTGAYTDFSNYALDHIYWPPELEGKNVNGFVKLRYTIGKEGKLENLEIIQSPHPLLSKEVERFFHDIPGWSPAISHNRPVIFTGELEIPFFR